VFTVHSGCGTPLAGACASSAAAPPNARIKANTDCFMFSNLTRATFYLVAGCVAMGASFLALGTPAGDLLLAAVDPRVREGIAE